MEIAPVVCIRNNFLIFFLQYSSSTQLEEEQSAVAINISKKTDTLA